MERRWNSEREERGELEVKKWGTERNEKRNECKIKKGINKEGKEGRVRD